MNPTEPDPCARCLQPDDACQCYSAKGSALPNDAERYADSIAGELRTWNAAMGGHAESISALADVLADLAPDESPHVGHYLNGIALEVTTWRGEHTDTDVIVEILRTYGGPTCRIQWDSRYIAMLAVTVGWGRDAAAREVYAPVFGEQVAEFFG